MKTLLLDIETSPHEAYAWSLFRTTIASSQILEASQMICVAAKWVGEKKVYYWSLFHHSREEMLAGIHGLMDEADAIVHYNGNSFDIPIINWEFLTGGFTPPAPSKHVDLYRVVRKNFKFASNKLAYVTEAMGLPTKLSHSGFDLWKKCLAGDRNAWKTMREYNKQDVRILEDLYEKLLPWMDGPNRQLWDGADVCPACASVDLERRGFAYTNAGRYQRYRCNRCGKWSRAARRVDGVTLHGVRS